MARKKLEVESSNRSENLSELRKLVADWGPKKSTVDSLDKEVKADAAKIKELMMKEELDESTSGIYTAKLSFQNKETINEEGLLQYIKTTLWGDKGSMHCPYIKLVETIDWDALEKDIYNGKITKEQVIDMDKFRTINKTPILKLKKEE